MKPAAFLRRKRGPILFLALAGGLAWGSARLLDPLYVPVSRVRVESHLDRLDTAEVKAALDPLLGRGFFALDLERVRAAIQALPWVAEVRLRRVWPRTLVVRVRERRAFARWGDAALVTANGEVFQPRRASIPHGLPRLDGPPGSAPLVVAAYQGLARRLAEKALRLTALQRSPRGAWSARLGDGTRIELGAEALEARLERLLNHLDAIRAGGRPARIDLRYAAGFAVAWHPPDPENHSQ